MKAVELKLSQGARPGAGGLMPARKNTNTVASVLGVEPGIDIVSPARHSEFDDVAGMLRFLGELRRLGGGKPIGIKLCVGSSGTVAALIQGVERTGVLPDFSHDRRWRGRLWCFTHRSSGARRTTDPPCFAACGLDARNGRHAECHHPFRCGRTEGRLRRCRDACSGRRRMLYGPRPACSDRVCTGTTSHTAAVLLASLPTTGGGHQPSCRVSRDQRLLDFTKASLRMSACFSKRPGSRQRGK